MGYWEDVDQRPRWPLVVAGAAVGALVVGLIWVVQAWATKDVRDESPPESAVVDPTRTESEATERLARCHEVYQAQTEPLRAAEASLTQWEIHVGAMNQLVTGVITLEQAREFWDETRLSAQGLLARNTAAVNEYRQRTARCPLTRPGTMTDDVRRCGEAVGARGTVLYKASVAETRWSEHVHHMEMLRRGEMTPTEATELWLANWKQGAQELRDYRAALDRAEGQTC